MDQTSNPDHGQGAFNGDPDTDFKFPDHPSGGPNTFHFPNIPYIVKSVTARVRASHPAFLGPPTPAGGQIPVDIPPTHPRFLGPPAQAPGPTKMGGGPTGPAERAP